MPGGELAAAREWREAGTRHSVWSGPRTSQSRSGYHPLTSGGHIGPALVGRYCDQIHDRTYGADWPSLDRGGAAFP